MEENFEKSSEEMIEVERVQLPKELLLDYTKEFVKKDLACIINFCYEWDGTNKIWFGSTLPEDIIFKVLELINEGRRKCYTNSYRHFKNSVYYHVKHELLTFFKCRKKEELTENSLESFFTITDAENFMKNAAYVDGAEEIFKEIDSKDLCDKVLSLFDPNNDVEEILVLEEYFKNNVKRKDIADALKISVEEVTTIQKRIKRKVENYLNKDFFRD